MSTSPWRWPCTRTGASSTPRSASSTTASSVRCSPAAGRPAIRSETRIGPIYDRHRRADADDEGHDRRARARPRGRARLRGPHGGATRSRARRCYHGRPPAVRRHAGHPVRQLVGDHPHRRPTTLALDGLTVCGTQGPLVGRPSRRRAGADGAAAAAARRSSSCGRRSTSPTAVPLHRVRGRGRRPWSEGRAVLADHRPRGRHRRTRRRGSSTSQDVDARHRLGARAAAVAAGRADVPPPGRSGPGADQLEPLLTFRMRGRRLHPPDVGPRPLARRARRRPARRTGSGDRQHRAPPPPRAAGDAGDVGRPGRPRRARAARVRPAPAQRADGLQRRLRRLSPASCGAARRPCARLGPTAGATAAPDERTPHGRTAHRPTTGRRHRPEAGRADRRRAVRRRLGAAGAVQARPAA